MTIRIGRAIRVWLQHHGFRVSTADGRPSGFAALDSSTLDLIIANVMGERAAFPAALRRRASQLE
jgi:hypothetical protein